MGYLTQGAGATGRLSRIPFKPSQPSPRSSSTSFRPHPLKKKEPPTQSKKGTKRIKKMKRKRKRNDRSTKTTGSPTVERSSHQPDRRMGARSWYREKGEVDSPAAHMTAAGGWKPILCGSGNNSIFRRLITLDLEAGMPSS